MPFAIDANSSQAFAGEESSLGVVSPGPWTPLEPNSFGTWGVDTKTVQRSTLNISRQTQKGTVTERDVTAAFQTDMTQTNIARILQGFFFADVAEKPATIPTNGAATTIASVSSTQFITGAAVALLPKHLVLATGLANSANNGPMIATAVAGTAVTAAPLYGGATVAEAAPPAGSNLKAVGFRLSAAAAMSGLLVVPTVLSDSGTDFTTLGLNIGEWLYVGDIGNVSAGSNYNLTGATSGTTLRGYARLSGIAVHALTFDFVTFANGSDATATTTAGLHIWFGAWLANQSTLATIKRRSYTLPRYLGKGIASADQLEIMLGCVPDKFGLNIAQASKLTADLSFVGIDADYQNVAMLTGTVLAPFNEPAINTSQDMFASLLTVNGTEAASLFAYSTDAKFDLDNGAAIARALGTATGFDVMVGDFKTNITASCYFDDIAALRAVQNNADVGYTSIFASRNAGFIFDVPLLTLGGGQLKLEKDKKIMVDLTGAGAAAKANYTASYVRFSYLPSSAMSKYTGI